MTVGEVLLWLLFLALLVPAGVVGWAIGHSTAGGTRTVTRTVTAASASTTTAAAAPATATTTATTTTTATKTSPGPSAAGNAAKGKAVFLANACGSCHTFKPAGSTATIGPDLDAKPAVDAKKNHMSLAAFVRESIVKPNAYISPGYPKGVMPQTFGTQLSKAQLADLVAFITAGK
jgi:mono/diheme cytochrome c family protein